jgi:hypothetical protein
MEALITVKSNKTVKVNQDTEDLTQVHSDSITHQEVESRMVVIGARGMGNRDGLERLININQVKFYPS